MSGITADKLGSTPKRLLVVCFTKITYLPPNVIFCKTSNIRQALTAVLSPFLKNSVCSVSNASEHVNGCNNVRSPLGRLIIPLCEGSAFAPMLHPTNDPGSIYIPSETPVAV